MGELNGFDEWQTNPRFNLLLGGLVVVVTSEGLGRKGKGDWC